ncbi:MAG: HPP family protein [Desulfobacteraceae bacterium]
MKIGEVLDKLDNLPYLAVSGDATLEQVAEKITDMRQVRGIYVVDEQGRLEGAISLGALIRHVIEARNKPSFFVRSLLSRITCEKVSDLMDKHVIYARKSDALDKVIDRMAGSNIKEIPIVDDQGRIIANVSILDLWKLAEK